MKQLTRYGYFLGVALLTFGAGVASGSLYRTAVVVRPFSAAEVEVRFKKASRDYYITLEYEVLNRSSHPLRYDGYAEGSNENWSVRRGDQSKSFRPFCGTGLKERTLGPGESETFQAFVEEAGPVRVGFEFMVGEERVKQTFWSDEIFVAEPLSADGN